MNKNILLLAGAGAAYWYFRNKQSQSSTSTGTSLTTGAASYVPVTTVQPTATSSTPSWVTNTAGTIATAGQIVQTGISLWDTVHGAFNTAKAPINTDVTADGSGSGFWSGQYPVS